MTLYSLSSSVASLIEISINSNDNVPKAFWLESLNSKHTESNPFTSSNIDSWFMGLLLLEEYFAIMFFVYDI